MLFNMISYHDSDDSPQTVLAMKYLKIFQQHSLPVESWSVRDEKIHTDVEHHEQMHENR